jgi:hypothetical protein
MAEAIEALSGKLGLDTTDFKAGISAANRELRVLESGFRASASSLGDWTKSADGLEMRVKSLTGQIDIQKAKVGALREEYERVKAEKGENSRAAQDLEIKLNKETETLGKMENELQQSEQALQEMGQAEDETGQKAEEAGGKVSGFKQVIGGIGGIVKGAITVVAGLAVAVVAVTTAIGGLVFSTADASAQLVDMSAKTGISTTRLQELAYVGEQVGTSQDTITGSLARLTRSMFTAQTQYADYVAAQADAAAKGEEFDGQLGDSAAAFDRLGVSVTDGSGNLRDSEAVFNDLLTALGNVPNEAERDALSMSLFGKSAMELNPLIKAGSEELARLSQEAHDVGAVMSEEDVSAFEEFDDTLSSLQMGLKGTVGTLMSAFLPGFQSVFNQAGGYLRTFSDIVKNSDGDIGHIAQGLGGLIGQIIGDLATQAPQMLTAGLGILQSIIDAIVTNLPVMIPAAIGMITSLLQFLIDNLPTIIEAGLLILIALVDGIADALPTLIPAVVQAVITIVQTLANNLPMLIDAAMRLIMALAEGLIVALPILIAALPQIIYTILNALVDALPMIFESAGKLIGMLATGIVAAIPVLLVAAGELIVSLARVLADFWTELPELGKNFVRGLVDGIQSAAGWLWDAVTGLIQGMLDRMYEMLDMHSPSGVGKRVGRNLFSSIGIGGEEEQANLQRKVTRILGNLTANMQANLSPLTGGGLQPALATAGGGSISLGNIYIDARGAQEPEKIGQAVRNGVLSVLRSKGVR